MTIESDEPAHDLTVEQVAEVAIEARDHTLHLERLLLAYHKSNGERLAAIEQQIGALPQHVRNAVQSAKSEWQTAMQDLVSAMRTWESHLREHTRALDSRNAIEQERTRILASALSGVGSVVGHRHSLSLAWLLGVTVLLRTAGVEPGPLVVDLVLQLVGK